MTNKLAILPGVCLYLISAALAQERPNGFYLSSPLSVSSGYDSGLFAGDRPLHDSVSILAGPTLNWIYSTHRSLFSVDYQPEGEIFANHPEFSAWNHMSTMRFTHRIDSRWTFDAGNSFLSTVDSSRQLQNSLLLLPLGRFLQNSVFGDLRYRLDGSTKLTFRADNAVTTMDLAGPMKERLDYVTTAGTVTVDRSLTSRQTLSGTYSFLYVRPFHPEASGSASRVNLFLLGYLYQVSPTVLLRATAGGATGTTSAFNGSAAVEKQFGGVWVAAGYQKYIGFFGGFAPVGGPTSGSIPFANGLTPNSVYQVVSLRAAGQISRRWGIEAVGQKALTGKNNQGTSLHSLIGQLRLSYKVNNRYTVFARAEHYGQNISEFSSLPLSRSRYLLGLEVALAKPPVTEGNGARRRRGADPEESKGPEPSGSEGK